MSSRVLDIAHRGACLEAPENTLPAFERAIEAGADWLELDVRATSDGRLVIMHDEDLERIAGVQALVGEMPLAEVRRLDAGAYFGEEFAGTRFPTLDEVVELADGRAGLLVEVKEPRERAGEIARAVAAALDGFSGDAWVESFDMEFVALYKRMYGDRPAALLSRSVRMVAEARAVGADAVSVSVRSLAAMVIPRARAAGLGCFAWTIRGVRSLALALHWEVDGVITDRPREVRAVLDGLRTAEAERFGGSPPEGKAYNAWRRTMLKGMTKWPTAKRPGGRG